MTPLLVIDIGNTRTACGLFADGKIAALTHFERFSQRELKAFLKGKEYYGCVFASVVPAASDSFNCFWCRRGRGPLCRLNWTIVSKALKNKIKVFGSQPGDDRAANAYLLHKLGNFPAVSVDAGTALTTEVLDGKGVFLGGLIAPGAFLQRESLSGRTAQLKGLAKGKPALIGSSSETAISAGVEGLLTMGLTSWLAEVEKEVLGESFKSIVFTGGGAELYFKEAKKLFKPVVFDPLFTLKALALSFFDEDMRKLYSKLQKVVF
ncbi:type III pantothenate kinase [bacterium]|nr:type III pantothenate kinase [bacterium]